MADTDTGQEKTETATSRKRGRAREDGNVPKSQELNTVLILISGVIAFYFFIQNTLSQLMEAIKFYLGNIMRPVYVDQDIGAFSLEIGIRVITILAPYFILAVLASLLINIAQVGFMFSSKALQPNLKKLNPISGIKRLFSMRGRMELLKAMVKLMIIAPVMIYTVYQAIPGVVGLMYLDPSEALIYLGTEALRLAIRALFILLILALIDYTYQRWQFEQDIKMTKQEVRQENKDIQGDPQIRSRIRSIQMEMARKRMMEQVPEAEVVVTNPTEYAIAIRYNSEEHPAPQVIAKGKNLIAKRIRDIAEENGIPIVENRPLAQSLYKLVDVGGLIPPDLYQAVAEVLAYIYKLTKKIPQEV